MESKDSKWSEIIITGVSSIIYTLIAAWGVLVLWNAVMPRLFDFPQLNYWDALAIEVLAGFLFYHPRPRRQGH